MTYREKAEKVWLEAKVAWMGRRGAIKIIAAALEAAYRKGVEEMRDSLLADRGYYGPDQVRGKATRLLEGAGE